jgi:hypothetical protein
MDDDITHIDGEVCPPCLVVSFEAKLTPTGYLLPNDEIENDRLDIHHELILTAMHGKLHLAPIKNDMHKALDLGTGTGIWALDFGK